MVYVDNNFWFWDHSIMNQVKSKIPISIIVLCIFLTLAAIYVEHEKKADVLNNSKINNPGQ